MEELKLTAEQVGTAEGRKGEEYRGGKITSYIFLDLQCHCCKKRACIQVNRSNSAPPPEYVEGGSIATFYCSEHSPVAMPEGRG